LRVRSLEAGISRVAKCANQPKCSPAFSGAIETTGTFRPLPIVSAIVPAPFVPDGGLIDGKYPVSGGGTIFGNLGRNILIGPDQQDFDIAAIKTTPLTHRVKLIFRWEIFNALNRPNFANPSNDVSTPSTFGVISALTVNPRIMQYAIKLEF
jgi:hypothetical protein